MDTPAFTIIPAHPGYRLIYRQDDGFFVDDEVIAWRVATELRRDQLASDVTPLTTEGDPAGNWAGLLKPNGSVDVLGTQYESLDEANAAAKRGET